MTIQPTSQPVGGFLRRCLALGVTLLLLTGCGAGAPEDLLDRMSHTWVTDAPAYEGARLVISREKIYFYAVDGSASVGWIDNISYRADRLGDLLTIEYRNRHKQKYLFEVYILDSPIGDILVRKNQQHFIWKIASAGQ